MGRPRISSTPRPDWAAAMAAARKEAGYPNQASFGAAVGFTQQSVADWESGKRRPPPEAVPTIAAKLKIPPATLLPPGLAAAMEDQSPLSTSLEIDDALAGLVAQVHSALTEAGATPTIRNAARLAIRIWRHCGGTLNESADPDRLRGEVQNVRELWRDLTMLHRDKT